MDSELVFEQVQILAQEIHLGGASPQLFLGQHFAVLLLVLFKQLVEVCKLLLGRFEGLLQLFIKPCSVIALEPDLVIAFADVDFEHVFAAAQVVVDALRCVFKVR